MYVESVLTLRWLIWTKSKWHIPQYNLQGCILGIYHKFNFEQKFEYPSFDMCNRLIYYEQIVPFAQIPSATISNQHLFIETYLFLC
jgi:hypothetical protein